MRHNLYLLCGIAVFFAMAVPVEAMQSLQSGQWRLTSKNERNGVVTEKPTATRCISPDQAKQIPRRTPPDTAQHANCTTADFKESGNAVSWRMQCTGTPTVETIVNYTVPDPQHYTATFKSTVTLGSMTRSSTLSIQGTRTGECPK